MRDLITIIQKIVQAEIEKIWLGELGVVTSVFPHSSKDDKDNYECNVKLKNNSLELRKVPVATGHIGTTAIPNVGDLVLISFVRGDVNQPIITHRLYNDKDRPPLNHPNEIIHRLPLHAEDDKAIKIEIRNIDEKTPPREMVIEMPKKIRFHIMDHQILAQVDKTSLTLKQQGDNDGEIIIATGKTSITIYQDGEIRVESEGKMNIKGRGDLSISAPNINLKSDQAIKIEAGTDGTFKTGAGAKIESGAPMEIKSRANAKIEAVATLDIKGAMVNIN